MRSAGVPSDRSGRPSYHISYLMQHRSDAPPRPESHAPARSPARAAGAMPGSPREPHARKLALWHHGDRPEPRGVVHRTHPRAATRRIPTGTPGSRPPGFSLFGRATHRVGRGPDEDGPVPPTSPAVHLVSSFRVSGEQGCVVRRASRQLRDSVAPAERGPGGPLATKGCPGRPTAAASSGRLTGLP